MKTPSFLENEEYGKHQEHEPDRVVQAKRLILEQHDGKDGKNDESDRFLEDFELPQVQRSSVLDVADAIGRDLETILEQGDSPTDQNDGREAESGEPVRFFLEFQMAVPRECHEDVRENQKNDGQGGFHTSKQKQQPVRIAWKPGATCWDRKTTRNVRSTPFTVRTGDAMQTNIWSSPPAALARYNFC